MNTLGIKFLCSCGIEFGIDSDGSGMEQAKTAMLAHFEQNEGHQASLRVVLVDISGYIGENAIEEP